VPFLLKFNINTQIRYLNTLDSLTSFTDHLGNVYPVHLRNDTTVNRFMFILGGYIFDKRLLYSGTVWTAAGAASIVVAGNIGWAFNKALTITGGYTGVPGSRSLVNTFPFFTASDRSMADNFFRPGFTQGVWASGEPVKGLNYLMMLANGLNTLNISAAKIDTNLAFSGSLWWEPLGPYGGTAGQMVSGSGVPEALGVTGKSRFDASGPLPLKSTFDHGGEFSASYFVKPKTWMPYIRGSWVIGQFGNSYEYGGGVKWFYLPTERTWLQAELFRVNKSPYSGTFTPYTAGLTGWVPMLQWYLAF
jgi:hypothetical protein